MNSWGVIKPNSIIIPNDGDIGSAGANDAIQIDSNGIVTFKDDIKIKDGGTIGTATTDDAMTVASNGIVTFKDDILVKNDGTIGSAGAATAITIDSDGNITLVGNLVVDSTKGIDFSATANAPNSGTTTDSELLNDYEEGRFTAIIGATSTNPNLTYSEQEGRYVKIGRQVTCWFRIQVNTAYSTGSGYLVLKTLPFTVSSDVDETGGSIGRANGWSGDHPVTMQADAGQVFAFFNGNFENDMLNGSDDLGSGAHVTGCISYLT